MIPKFNKKDVKIEITKGQGPGGQHRNKTSSMVKLIHVPTGVKVNVDGRNQGQNKKVAFRKLEQRVTKHYQQIKAKTKKAHRDKKIKDKKYIRTYNFQRNTVKDHRTGKTASLNDVLKKGRFDLLN